MTNWVDKDKWIEAASKGNLEELDRLFLTSFASDYFDVFCAAIDHGQYCVLDWGYEHDELDDYRVFYLFEHSNYKLSLLNWIYLKFPEWLDPLKISRLASIHKNKKLFEWAIAHNLFSRDPVILNLSITAFNTDRDLTKWLYSQGCLPNADTMSYATQTGSLDLLKFFVERGCPMTPDTMAFAVRTESLDMVRYLIANKCPVDFVSIGFAIEKNNMKILKLLERYDNVFRRSTESRTFCLSAFNNNNFLMLAYLLQHGFHMPTDESTLLIACETHPTHSYNAIAWLHQHQKYWSTSNLVQWLLCIHESLECCIYVPDLIELIKSFV